MSLADPANKVFLENHSAAHTTAYKQYVLDHLTEVTKALSRAAYKDALMQELNNLKNQLLENPCMPYKGGL